MPIQRCLIGLKPTSRPFDLRAKFLGEAEESQTPLEEIHVIEIKDEAQEKEVEVQEFAPNAIIPFIAPHPPTCLLRAIRNIFLFIM